MSVFTQGARFSNFCDKSKKFCLVINRRRIAVNKLYKQPRTAEEGWSSSWGVERGANNASPLKNNVKKYSQGKMLPLETKQSGGKLLPHSDLREGVFLGQISSSSAAARRITKKRRNSTATRLERGM